MPKDKTKTIAESEEYGSLFIKGFTSVKNVNKAKKAGDLLQETIAESLKKPLDIVIPMHIDTDVKFGNAETPMDFINIVTDAAKTAGVNISTKPKKNNKTQTASNATGTNYFGGGPTRINEHGGEIIDLPTGTRIYPADKSEKMMQSVPNISVNVNVDGNIIGIENAAEIIGNQVCGKIIDLLAIV